MHNAHRFCLYSLLCAMVWSADLHANTVTESGSDAFDASFWGINPTPDLVSATVTYDLSNLYVSVRVAPGFPAFDPVTQRGRTFIGVYLDIDQNPATGGSYSNPPTDTANLGYERRVGFSSTSTSASLSNNAFVGLGTFPATTFPDGFATTIPLSALGDDGLVNFKVIDYVQLSAGSTTSILDVLPNTGLSAGTSSFVPEPSSLLLVSMGFLVVSVPRLRRRFDRRQRCGEESFLLGDNRTASPPSIFEIVMAHAWLLRCRPNAK